jgi:hypothetical protein
MDFKEIKHNESNVLYEALYRKYAEDVYKGVIQGCHISIVLCGIKTYLNTLEIDVKSPWSDTHILYRFNFDGLSLLNINILYSGSRLHYTKFLDHCVYVKIAKKYFNIDNFKNNVCALYTDSRLLDKMADLKLYTKYVNELCIDVTANFRKALYDENEAKLLTNCIELFGDCPKICIAFVSDYSLNENLHGDVLAFNDYVLYFDRCTKGAVYYRVTKNELQ